MQWNQKREKNAFEIVVQNAWGVSSPSKQVARSSTLCRKRSQVWGAVAKISAAEMPVLEMRRILENKLSPLRVYIVQLLLEFASVFCMVYLHPTALT